MEQVAASVTVNSAKPSHASNLSEMALNLVDACRKYHQESIEALQSGESVIKGMGPVRVDGAHMSVWHALNEISGQRKSLEIPLMTIGEEKLVAVTSAGEAAPAVDEVSKKTGTFATIFQRLNEGGDMLRVASSLKSDHGTRAIGTFVPAEGRADESAKVLQTVLSGKTYVGKEVLNKVVYLTAYQPLKNTRGAVVGMLNTALPEEQIEAAARHLANTSNKERGEKPQVFIFEATGEMHGKALAMADQALEGRNLWNEKDGAGRAYVQEICSRAAQLPPGELAEYKFEKAARVGGIPRSMTARFAFVPELGWAVGFAQPETDMQASLSPAHLLVWMLWLLSGVGIASSGLALRLWLKFSDDFALQLSSLLNHLRKDTKQLTKAAIELTHEAEHVVASLPDRVVVPAVLPVVTYNSERALQHIDASNAWVAEMLDAFEQITGSTNYLNINSALHSAHSRRVGDPFAEELRALVQRCRQAAHTAQSEIRQSRAALQKGESPLVSPEPVKEVRPERDENAIAMRRQAEAFLKLAAGIDRTVGCRQCRSQHFTNPWISES